MGTKKSKYGLITVLFVYFIVLLSSKSEAQQMGWYGIAYEDSKCVVLSNNMGFILVELYSGVPIKGVAVFGPVNTYGAYQFYDQNGNQMFYGYIDDWGMSKQRG